MKIGFLVNTMNPKRGDGRFSSDIINEVISRGHKVVVLKAIDDGLRGEPILRSGLGVFKSLSQIREKFKDCDVIHTTDAYPYGVIGWLINRKLKKKLIISALGTYAVAPLYRWQTSYLVKQTYKSAYKVIAISKFTKNKILEKLKLNNIVVINPGIKLDKEMPQRIESDEKFILGVGALKERKGYHISLKAFALVSKEFPDLKYKIVADQDKTYRAVLDEIIMENNLEEKVEFLSQISDEELCKLYSSASLFVLTSINTADIHFEGFGIVYLEAARFGLPVIGTLDTGGEDAINNEKNGILVHQNNVNETAEAMRRILSNRSLWEQTSKESIEWARLNSIEKEVNRLMEIYDN